MIFLDTTDTMKIIDYDGTYSTYYIDITDDMLDLTVPNFANEIYNKVHHYNYGKDIPVEFIIRCDELDDDDIEYSKNMIIELLTESIRKEKINKNWQPSVELGKRLDMNIKSQTNLLNFRTEPNILDIKFAKNGKIVYNILREEKEKTK